MLILTRRPGETIVATTGTGERIEITVLRMGPGQARIGVHAPSSVTIDREEIDERKRQERGQ